MKKSKKKKKRGILRIFIPLFIWIIMILGCAFCYINVSPVSKKSKQVFVTIKSGSGARDIVHTLKEKNLIRNEEFMLLYIKLNEIGDLKAGDYYLNKNMKPRVIFDILHEGSNLKEEEITITFPEGKTMRKMASIIEDNSKNTVDDVYSLLEDKEYINSLISKYWFLDESILNENIYYPLEGYLAPDTYNFKADASVKDIFEKLLNQTDKILTEYKANIDASTFSPHQVLTLASMVESEAVTLEDRKNVAGVFINRLNAGMSLGSDVTTYYAAKVDMGERDLYNKEISSDNPYNTRSSSNAGKLPVGPICNPSKDAIIAVLEYTPNEYYYFVSDKNRKVYFTKTDAEHTKKVSDLKKEGLWYEY